MQHSILTLVRRELAWTIHYNLDFEILYSQPIKDVGI